MLQILIYCLNIQLVPDTHDRPFPTIYIYLGYGTADFKTDGCLRSAPVNAESKYVILLLLNVYYF